MAELFKSDAKRLGMSYAEYCREYGLLSDAAEQKWRYWVRQMEDPG